MSVRDHEARIRRLEDIEEIKQLKNRYCYAVDQHDWKTTMSLFARVSNADYGPFGKPRNKAEIKEFFTKFIPKNLPFFVHNVHNAIIEVKGDRAKGRWYFEVPATEVPGNAIWIMGRYDNDMVRDKGQWKFKSMRCTFFYVTPFEKGWAKQRMPSGDG